MTQSTEFQDQLGRLKSAVQSMVQAIVAANLDNETAQNALKLQGHTYQDILDTVAGATTVTVADLAQSLSDHEADTTNPHNTSKADVGLSMVENLALALKSDLATKTPSEIDNINHQYVTPKTAYYLAQRAVATISSTAPETLDTINEIAAALQNNPDIIQNILDELGNKVSVANLNQAISAITKADFDLDKVENFPVATKPQAENAAIDDRYMVPSTTHHVVENAVISLMEGLETEFNNAASLIHPQP